MENTNWDLLQQYLETEELLINNETINQNTCPIISGNNFNQKPDKKNYKDGIFHFHRDMSDWYGDIEILSKKYIDYLFSFFNSTEFNTCDREAWNEYKKLYKDEFLKIGKLQLSGKNNKQKYHRLYMKHFKSS